MKLSEFTQFLTTVRPYIRIESEKILTHAVNEGIALHAEQGLTPIESALWQLINTRVEMTPVKEFTAFATVEHRVSAGSKSPMWTLRGEGGEVMWVLEHNIPERNTISVFDSTAWGKLLREMVVGDTWLFTHTPIYVQTEADQNGYLRPLAVMPMPEGTRPDGEAAMTAKREKARESAIKTAWEWLNIKPVVFADTETTGLKNDAEPVSIAVLNRAGDTLYAELVKPGVPIEEGAMKIHGITDTDVKSAPQLVDVWDDIALIGEAPCIFYNAEYDLRVINQAFIRAGQEPPLNETNTLCAMKLYAQYNGLWNDKRSEWQSVKLTDACKAMGIEVGETHDAEADAYLTYQLVKKLADRNIPV